MSYKALLKEGGMRICLYTETALPKMGGQEIVVDALARQFLHMGHDVVVLAPHPRLPLRARDHLLPYRVVRHPRFFSTRHFVPWYRWFLSRILRHQGTEILHCHGLYPPGYLAALARARHATPMLITSHGGDVHQDNVRLVKPELHQRTIRGLAAADRLVAISRFTESRMRVLCPQATIANIPNGVDLSPYVEAAARPQGLSETIRPGDYFLFLGRLKERKGVDMLLHALSRISPVCKIPLVVAGAGEEQAALEQLTARLGIGSRVLFVGPVHHPAKAYLLQNALATVVPSRIWEAFGLVALESFAAGTPVIATRLPGLEDLIDPGKTGWLVAPESPLELANALQQADNQRSHCRQMGQHGRRWVQDYDWSAVAQRHLDLYRELLSQKTARAA
jgi:glycogen(starch) synthase